MTPTTPLSNAPLPDLDFRPLIEGPTVYWDSIARFQRLQVEMLVAFEQSLARMNQEAWDQWVCHFGGGAPIDY